jgi:hypothetical protein
MAKQETSPGGQQTNGVNGRVANSKVDFDAIVIGAGFGGLRMMYELQKQGISGKLFESGSGVGGVCLPHPYSQNMLDARECPDLLLFLFTFILLANIFLPPYRHGIGTVTRVPGPTAKAGSTSSHF